MASPVGTVLNQTSGYSISEIATHLGVTQRALRYYEEVGLVKPRRSRQNIRVYAGQALVNLETIAVLRRAGVDIETITWVLGAEGHEMRADRMAVAVEQRLKALEAQTRVLRALVRH